MALRNGVAGAVGRWNRLLGTCRMSAARAHIKAYYEPVDAVTSPLVWSKPAVYQRLDEYPELSFRMDLVQLEQHYRFQDEQNELLILRQKAKKKKAPERVPDVKSRFVDKGIDTIREKLLQLQLVVNQCNSENISSEVFIQQIKERLHRLEFEELDDSQRWRIDQMRAQLNSLQQDHVF